MSETVLNPIEVNRRTGRTSRLIKKARELSKEGRAVYIVCAHQLHSDLIDTLIRDDRNIKTCLTSSSSWNWEKMRIERSWPNCVFLVDNGTIEHEFGHIIRAYHRFDCKQSPVCEDILEAMKALQNNAHDTYWINNGETVFERLWTIYEEHGGDMEKFQETFPQYCNEDDS